MPSVTPERPKRTIKTSGGHEVVLYDYITGREQRTLQEIFLRNVEVNRVTQSDGKPDAALSGFNVAAISEAQDTAFGILIVSLDGSEEAIVDRVLGLPAREYEEVVAVINDITDPKKK